MARPRTYDDTLRRRLLEAASRAVAAGGPASLSVRAVAAEAGTTTAAVYTLFGGRPALVTAVAAEGFRRFGEHLAGAGRTGDPLRDLLALGVAYRRSALDEPHFYRAMFAPARAGADQADGPADPAAAGIGAPTFSVLRAAVADVLAARGDDPAGAEEAALRLWSFAHGLVSLELAGLLPGTPAERAQRYEAALRSVRV